MRIVDAGVDCIEVFGLTVASFRIRFTAEAQRSQREMFILIQSGDGDWIRNFIPSEWRQVCSDGYDTCQELCPKRAGAFSFGGISPPNETFLLCVLGVSAVKMLFWTGMIIDSRCIFPEANWIAFLRKWKSLQSRKGYRTEALWAWKGQVSAFFVAIWLL
jgi:hypothetical protein